MGAKVYQISAVHTFEWVDHQNAVNLKCISQQNLVFAC